MSGKGWISSFPVSSRVSPSDMNDYQILQDIGRSKSAMVYKVDDAYSWIQSIARKSYSMNLDLQYAPCLDLQNGPWFTVCSLNLDWQGRKKKTIEFFALKCVDKSQKQKIMHEVYKTALHSLPSEQRNLNSSFRRSSSCIGCEVRIQCNSTSGSKHRITFG